MLAWLSLPTLCAAQWYQFEVGFDAAFWTDYSSFPCPPSAYAAGENACDYWFQGWQTVPGKPRQVRGGTALLVSLPSTPGEPLGASCCRSTLRGAAARPPPSAARPQALANSGALVPGCCPEGVLFYSRPTPNYYDVTIADSPYALRYVSG